MKVLIIFFILFLSCKRSDVGDLTRTEYEKVLEQYLYDEQVHLEKFINQEVVVRGNVLNAHKNFSLEGVEIYTKENVLLAISDRTGSFKFYLPRKENTYLILSKSGFESRLVIINAMEGASEVFLDDIDLFEKEDNDIQFVFAGDTAFSRRMLDPSDTTPFHLMPTSNPDALVDTNNPLPGTINILKFVKPLYNTFGDYRILNFESPVVDANALPFYHPLKEYNFFTMQGSLPALKSELNIDYVSMGNNHVFDYQKIGLEQTLKALNDEKIPFSGAGHTSKEAFVPYIQKIKNEEFGLISASTVSGDRFPINFMAEENKGGSADFRRREDYLEVMDDLKSKDIASVVQLHTGKEYTFKTTDYVKNQFEYAVDSGAKIAIGHHPHIAQGFGVHKGVPLVYSLGNFVLDQDRLETMFGLVATLVYNKETGVKYLNAYPIYLEDYRPRIITGHLAGILLKRLGEYSDDDINVKINHGRIQIYFKDEFIVRKKRFLSIEKSKLNNNLIDLREYLKDTESLTRIKIKSKGAQKIKVGRDILMHGDHEDHDLDEDLFEVARYDVSGASRFSCFKGVYRGNRGLCSLRSGRHDNASVIAFRNSIRVMGDSLNEPNKDLTVLGYVKGKNSGPIHIYGRYTSSKGANFYGEETYFYSKAGSFNWTQFAFDVNMPADDKSFHGDPTKNARALRFFLKHNPPYDGVGVAMFDDMAVVSWENEVNIEREYELKTPNAIEFLKFSDIREIYSVELTFSY